MVPLTFFLIVNSVVSESSDDSSHRLLQAVKASMSVIAINRMNLIYLLLE